MNKKIGFTLIELLIVMAISAILAGVGIKGYMGTLRVERRQDAVLSLQKALIIIQSTDTGSDAMCPTPNPTGASVKYTDTTSVTTTSCRSNSSFYYLHYNPTGYTPTGTMINSMVSGESLILQANPVPGSSQASDTLCSIIYLSNQNKVYPTICGN